MLTLRYSRYLVPLALVWLLVGACLTLQLWPDLPGSWQHWALLFSLGPPLYVALEAWSSWVLSESHGWAVSRKRFSVLRILLLLPVVLFWLALAWWFASLIGAPQ